MKRLICVAGETCSGKDMMCNELIRRYKGLFNMVISHTNRPIRETETNGVEHWFHTNEEFQKLKEIKKLVAYTKISKDGINGYEYFACTDDLNNSNVYIIDPNGIKNLKENYPYYDILVVYIYSMPQVRILRNELYRKEDKSIFEERMKNEEDQFNEFRKNQLYDVLISNDDVFETAFNKFKDVCIDFIK